MRLLKSCAMPPLSWPTASHFLRHEELLLRLFQRQLIFHTVGYISSDLGKTDKHAVLIKDRINDYRGEKLRTVLANRKIQLGNLLLVPPWRVPVAARP